MFIQLLASLGLTFILKQGQIFDKPRDFIKKLHPKLKELFECGMCLGFWSGIFIGIISNFPFFSLTILTNILILGFASSFLGFIFHHFLVILEKLFEKSS